MLNFCPEGAERGDTIPLKSNNAGRGRNRTFGAYTRPFGPSCTFYLKVISPKNDRLDYR